jgi:hypothetical protein
MEPSGVPLEFNFILKFDFLDLKRSRSTSDDLDIVLFGYSVYHENELK